MILQLNPTIPLNTPRGQGEAIAIMDYSVDHYLMFVVALDDSGQIHIFDNTEVRAVRNDTIGRNNIDQLEELGPIRFGPKKRK